MQPYGFLGDLGIKTGKYCLFEDLDPVDLGQWSVQREELLMANPSGTFFTGLKKSLTRT